MLALHSFHGAIAPAPSSVFLKQGLAVSPVWTKLVAIPLLGNRWVRPAQPLELPHKSHLDMYTEECQGPSSQVTSPRDPRE